MGERMRKSARSAAMAAAVAAVAVLASVPAAEAQVGFGMSFGGTNLSQGDCRALAAKVGPNKVWFSRFSGSQPDPWDRGLWSAWGIGCFRTYKECKAWLYNSQTAYPRLMDFTFCKQGLPAR
ncbi:hypothetical protein GGR25_001727 [Kaistia hirudinis]|uniref:Uncharacterized protein n=1 Tax=Kaistia hirudinis TaxID=1293440 RepID=A0A840AMZ2_9HYPH|nr:hypothetical protein [Kaistia hirudinis]MBB3930688.1 hypothetical protein [Kaistia hirudinis]